MSTSQRLAFRPGLCAALWLTTGALAIPAAAQPLPTLRAFKPGIYYRLPNPDNPAARLARVGDPPDLVLPQVPQMSPVGWDLCSDVLVIPSPTPDGSSGLKLIAPSGQERPVSVPGLYSLVRPSLSWDCRFIAVQALDTPPPPAPIPGVIEDLNIYVIDLQTGVARRIGSLPWNEESPRFFPADHRLAYSSFSPTDGVNLHVYDVDQDQEIGVFRDIGALQIAISPDGLQFIDPRQMKIYKLDTGAVQVDLLQRAVQSLLGAGFELDQRFKDSDGTPNRGINPLDATFSPTGQELAIDWAVKRGDQYGNVIAILSLDGNDFSIATDLIPTNPQFTNNNNFSQLNPVWK